MKNERRGKTPLVIKKSPSVLDLFYIPHETMQCAGEGKLDGPDVFGIAREAISLITLCFISF
jgi:hypothetical protein